MTIGKLYFGKDAIQYGLELCLARAGRQAYRVTEATARAVDVLLVSMFWYLDVYAYERFKRRAGLVKGKPPIVIAGGMQATITPALISKMVDFVFLGDADDALGTILHAIEHGQCPEHPGLWDGEGEPPAPHGCEPSGFAVQTQGDDGGTTRIEIARGCKFKCAFCVLSGLKPYREVSTDAVIEQLRAAPPGRVSAFAPERTCHSGWPKIAEEMQRLGLHDLSQDVRLENMLKLLGTSATIGIEGPSERLRKAIGKRFSDQFILDRLGEFVTSKKRVCMIAAYFIADLPSETNEDWEALRLLFEKMEAAEWSRWLVFKPVLNPLSPKPYTRLADATVHPFRDYETPWLNLLRKDGGQWGFRIVESLVWGPWRRMLDLLVHRGGAEAYGIIHKLPDALLGSMPKKTRRMAMARQLLDECSKHGLAEDRLLGGSTPTPALQT